QDPEYVYAKAWLVQKDGPEVGKKFPMYWEEITIGRDDENAIVIRDDAVSLRHARIKEMKGAYYLFDLASDNGTFLNGKKLLRPRPLYDWDELRMGRTLFIFRGSKLS
ncbi:MAG: FHA domain-containing protein, partial [Spirochaetales bacterium]